MTKFNVSQTRIQASGLRKLRCTLGAVSMALLLASCTSSLVLGTAYNAAAKRTADRLKTFAEFDQAQQLWIEQAFQNFQQWHRVTELPDYSTFLNGVAATLQSNQPIRQSQLRTWLDTVEQRGKKARACSPLNGATTFFIEMTDWQIQQLQKKLVDSRQEQIQKYQSETVDERRQRRQDSMVTWASRAGLKMTDEQQQALGKTLASQTSMGERRFQLRQEWTDQFIDLLQKRNTAEFPALLRTHIERLWGLTEKKYPDEWKQNRELWQTFAHSLLNDLSAEQRRSIVETMTSVSKSINTLSKKKSRATPVCYND